MEVVPCLLDDGLDMGCESKRESKKILWFEPDPQNRWDASHQNGESGRLGDEVERKSRVQHVGLDLSGRPANRNFR